MCVASTVFVNVDNVDRSSETEIRYLDIRDANAAGNRLDFFVYCILQKA